MDLHELLEVEEGFRNGKLVTTTRGRKEVFELIAIRKLQNDLINFAKWLSIHILQVLPFENCLEEKLTDLVHVGVLQRHLRINLLNLVRKLVLESCHNTAAPHTD